MRTLRRWVVGALMRSRLGREVVWALPGRGRAIMEADRENFTLPADSETVRSNLSVFFLREGVRRVARPSERIVELPTVWQELPRPPAKILDVGSGRSLFPLQLASLGYETHTLDIFPYPHQHPNLVGHVADVREFATGAPYDAVVSISTLEHIGLGAYGERAQDRGDLVAVRHFRSLLRHGGLLILTLPYGGEADDEGRFGYRMYGPAGIAVLREDWETVGERYFRIIAGSWVPATPGEVERTARHRRFPGGVVTLVLRRA